jgi:hypothetical protein
VANMAARRGCSSEMVPRSDDQPGFTDSVFKLVGHNLAEALRVRRGVVAARHSWPLSRLSFSATRASLSIFANARPPTHQRLTPAGEQNF